MTKIKENKLEDKDARIAYLEKLCQWDLFFLDLIASMGDLHGDDFLNRDVNEILNLTRRHLNRFMDFRSTSFFSINESDSSFILTNCDPEAEKDNVQKAVDLLIEDGTFAWALNQNRPVVVKKDRFGHTIILHVLSTKVRIRGMFVGILPEEKDNITDAHLYPLSISLHYTASALESTALYNMLSNHNKNLQETVKKRTRELENQAEELKKYRDQLEELVEERTSQLKSAQGQLIHAEKLSAVGKLSASISHEFNNPITGIRNVLERVAKKVQMDATNKDLVCIALKECTRMTDLIQKLRDFHCPSPGIVTPLDIHKLIEEVMLLSKVKLKVRGIKIEKRYARHIPEIQAISDQIKQVILNIINNAEEAIPDEGGKIKIITEVSDSFIKISFQDSGCGISPEDKKSIFEPFYTTKAESKGTGLGLSISYGIIKKHGGEIEVESEPGKGTTFILTLPIEGAVDN